MSARDLIFILTLIPIVWITQWITYQIGISHGMKKTRKNPALDSKSDTKTLDKPE
jgi:hypothetical protein